MTQAANNQAILSKKDIEGQALENSARRHLASWLIVGSFALIAGLSIYAVYSARKEEAAQTAKDILGTLLPMLGAWIGTVLAFYYAKENFTAASQGIKELVGKVQAPSVQEALKSIPLRGKEISRNQMEVVEMDAEQGVKGVTIKSLKERFDNNPGVTRLPILDSQGVIKCLIHQSLIYEFISKRSLEAGSNNQAFLLDDALTLQDLLDDPNPRFYSTATNSMGFVAQNGTLADVKKVMDGMTQVQDVFVTKSGSSTEPVLGWITNVTLAQAAHFGH